MPERVLPPEIGVVVINWNNYQETASCLNSLESLEYPDYRVIVVDNGSEDDSGDRLADEYGWCEFVFNDENLGFGGGCNTGIKSALDAGVQYVCILNNDALVDGEFLAELVSVAQESTASVVGALVTDEKGNPINQTPSCFPDMLFYSGYRSNLPFFPIKEDDSDERWRQTDRVEGAGVLLPRELLQERHTSLGYFIDDSLFMYGEEIELALWCRQAKLNSVIAQKAIVRHVGGASSPRSFQLYYLTRNRLLIARRYFDLVTWVGYAVLFAIWRILLAVRFLKRRNYDVAGATLIGLLDGLRQIDGRTR